MLLLRGAPAACRGLLDPGGLCVKSATEDIILKQSVRTEAAQKIGGDAFGKFDKGFLILNADAADVHLVKVTDAA